MLEVEMPERSASLQVTQSGGREAEAFLLPRPRLEGRLRRALGDRLTVVVAAPGYGKTAALQRAARLDGRRKLWYRCGPNERAPDVARGLLAGVSSSDSSRVDQPSSSCPHLLLVDDAHRLDEGRVDELILLFAGRLPACWHAMVASRIEPAHPEVLGLFCRGEAERLDEGDLALDVDEARAVALGRGLPPADGDRWWGQTLGWPMGVLAMSEGRGDSLAEYLRSFLHSLPSPRLRAFLEAVAVLEGLTPEACRVVAGSRDAPRLLDEAVASHLFVLRKSDNLVLHPLFRRTLRESLKRLQPRRYERLSRQAMDYYVSQGDPASALAIAKKAADWARAMELLRTVGPALVNAGQGEEMLALTDGFPANFLAEEPWLLHYRAVGLRLVGNSEGYATAWQMQEQACGAFAARGDRDGRVRALAELGALACTLSRPAEARRLLEEARAELKESEPVLQASVLCYLAEAYMSLNRLKEAIGAGEAALALADPAASSSMVRLRSQALQQLALARMRQGQPADAISLASRSVNLDHDYRVDAQTRVLSTYFLGFAYCNKGSHEKGFEILTEAATLATRYGLNNLRRRIDATRAEILAFLERLDESDQLFQEVGDAAGFLGDVGTLRFLQNRLYEARAIFLRRHEESVRLGSEADIARAEGWLGAVALQMGQLAEAERWLLSAARSFERAGAGNRLAGTNLHLAHLHLLRDQPHQWKRCLRAALEFGAQAECYSFYLWHPGTVATLAAHALCEGIQPEYVEALCVKRLRSCHISSLLSVLGHREGVVRARAVRIVNTILGREGASAALAELAGCHNPVVGARLTGALSDGRLTPRGLLVLRHQHGLTWAETDIFVEHYLTRVDLTADTLEPERRALAQRMGVSENTLMHHITSIRRKLGIGPRKGSATLFLWCLATGITNLPPLPSALELSEKIGAAIDVAPVHEIAAHNPVPRDLERRSAG